MNLLIFFPRQTKITGALRCLNHIELNEPLVVLENDLLDVKYAKKPCKELHLVYLKAALYCYNTGQYAKGANICQIACTVLRTPALYTLLAKCLIQVILMGALFQKQRLVNSCFLS